MTIRVQRADRDCQRILRHNEIVAFALKLANGQWALYDTIMVNRIAHGETFASARAAAKRFVELDTAQHAISTDTPQPQP